MGIRETKILLPEQCKGAVIPWRYLIKTVSQGLSNSFREAGIHTDIELIRVGSGSNGNDYFRNLRSIPYYYDLSSHEQEFVIDRINSCNSIE